MNRLNQLGLGLIVLAACSSAGRNEAEPHGQGGSAGSEGSTTRTPSSVAQGNTGGAGGTSAGARHDAGLDASAVYGFDPSAAIFVAATGNDSNPGTLDAPVAHIRKGVELATAAHKDVRICNGTYPENVVIDGVTSPIGLYGGYDCGAGWTHTTERATVAAPTGYALRVRNATARVTVDELALVAPGGINPGDSSIAVFVSNSPDVELSNSDLVADDGADGVAGTSPPSLAPLGPGPDGSSASGYTSCDTRSLVNTICGEIPKGGQYIGMQPGMAPNGGNGANAYRNAPTTAGESSPGGAPGGEPVNPGGLGANGANAGVTGAASTLQFGSVDAEKGYLSTNAGGNGGNGDDGQAGGGGSGGRGTWPCGYEICVSWAYAVGGGGGAGGYAGGGGQGGTGGGGGGASIALLIVDSTVSTSWCSFTTGAGGRGGSGGLGAQGQAGGLGGKGGTGSDTLGRADGKPGGNGGKGARGGAGGPGAGGPTLGVLVQGVAPTMTSPRYDVGSGGKAGGAGGIAIVGPDGAEGLMTSIQVLATPQTNDL